MGRQSELERNSNLGSAHHRLSVAQVSTRRNGVHCHQGPRSTLDLLKARVSLGYSWPIREAACLRTRARTPAAAGRAWEGLLTRRVGVLTGCIVRQGKRAKDHHQFKQVPGRSRTLRSCLPLHTSPPPSRPSRRQLRSSPSLPSSPSHPRSPLGSASLAGIPSGAQSTQNESIDGRPLRRRMPSRLPAGFPVIPRSSRVAKARARAERVPARG